MTEGAGKQRICSETQSSGTAQAVYHSPSIPDFKNECRNNKYTKKGLSPFAAFSKILSMWVVVGKCESACVWHSKPLKWNSNVLFLSLSFPLIVSSLFLQRQTTDSDLFTQGLFLWKHHQSPEQSLALSELADLRLK